MEKSAEKKTKTGRLPIAHYKQKPAGSDLWPVNRCIPSRYPAEKGEQTLRCAQLSARLSVELCSPDLISYHITLRSSAVADGTVFAWLS